WCLSRVLNCSCGACPHPSPLVDVKNIHAAGDENWSFLPESLDEGCGPQSPCGGRSVSSSANGFCGQPCELYGYFSASFYRGALCGQGRSEILAINWYDGHLATHDLYLSCSYGHCGSL